MPSRVFIAQELASILKVLAHPDRIRLVEELRQDACDVNELHARLELPATRVSQHLALLRAHRLVEERRDGRRHIYSLVHRDIADWLLSGIKFLGKRAARDAAAKDVIDDAGRRWAADAP